MGLLIQETTGQITFLGDSVRTLHDKSYAAIGIFGQYLFVDRDRKLVVTIWSAQPKPGEWHGVDEYGFLEALSRYFE